MDSCTPMKELITSSQINMKDNTNFMNLEKLNTENFNSSKNSNLQDDSNRNKEHSMLNDENNNNFQLEMTSMMNYSEEKNDAGTNSQMKEQPNAWLQFLNAYTHFGSFCSQNNNINPKFLNSMLKLMDKYNVPLNVSMQNNEKNAPTLNEKDDSEKNEKNEKNSSYKKFSEQEDYILRNVVNSFGAKNWRFIASMIPNKTARQCRDRYMNYLAPGFVHSDWTKEEDQLLAARYKEIGPHWAKIQRFFPNRTSNAIKNRFNYSVCRNKEFFNANKKPEISSNKCDSSIIHDVSNFENEDSNQVEVDYQIDLINEKLQEGFYNNFGINENAYNLEYLNF